MARHVRLAGEFTAHVARGDSYAAGRWLRRTARDPSVSPWLLLDLVAIHDAGVPGPRSGPYGDWPVSRGDHGGHRAVQARGTP